MNLQRKEFKYPLADARGSVVMPVQKIVPKKQEVSAWNYGAAYLQAENLSAEYAEGAESAEDMEYSNPMPAMICLRA
jgi:hypothetical protein